jgi:hypothetical protein
MNGHTRRDLDALTAAGVDPDTTQPRERAVCCPCGSATFNQSGTCDRHYQPPARTILKESLKDHARTPITIT